MLLAAAGLIVATASAPGQTPASKAYLLNVSKKQTFTEIGSDDKTKPEFVEDFKELAGKALKVAFSKGDSVGDRVAKVKNWKPFATLRLSVFNPGKDTVKLGLNILHARSTNYATRIEVPVVLKPGKNEVAIGIDELKNTNGSAPGPDRHPQVVLRRCRGQGADGVLRRHGAGRHGRAGEGPRRPGPAAAHPCRRDAQDRQADPVRHAGGRRHRVRPGSVSARQSVEPGHRGLAGASQLEEHHRIDRREQEAPLQPDMGYVLVPPDQKKVDVKLGSASAESDKGPYPVPDNTPIEGYPINYKGLTLDEVQRKDEGDIDRHALVVDPTNRMLYEFYQMRKTDRGWIASGAAIFDLKSNKLRPDGWTSADAAGLPIFPATVRYDEIKRGMVEHAMRMGVGKTRRAYVYPATHYASRDTDQNLPRMGERLRLKKNFDISGFSPAAQAILKGLKKYGMFVADNGLDWTISVAPDSRIPLLHEEFSRIKGSAFEVVERNP